MSDYGIHPSEFDELPGTPPWMLALSLARGVHEYKGPACHPIIAEMHAALGPGVESDEVAWCSSAVAWSFTKAGMLIPKGVTRAARSWLKADGLLDITSTRRGNRNPPIGAITVLWRESRDSWKGHVGLFDQRLPDGRIVLLGGNQGNEVNCEVYTPDRVLAYLWPRGFDPDAFRK